jgi:hypothetical protein
LREGTFVGGAAASLLMLMFACATVSPDGSFPAQRALVGKTAQEVLACAGEPRERTDSGEETRFTYYRKAPVFEKSIAVSKGSVPCPGHACRAVVVFKGDRVTEVQFHPEPPSLGGCEHCEDIFQACLP